MVFRFRHSPFRWVLSLFERVIVKNALTNDGYFEIPKNF
nr:MAG TPA_asm: hypothetical protein [Caudoviricetes sp.]